jgi:Arc/MetJ-type ribon-helix-helix transcriptional regulator
MRTITVRLPEAVAADIELESRERRISKSDVVRERLETRGKTARRRAPSVDAIADLIGSVDGLPAKLSTQKKAYLRRTAYGGKRRR